MKPFLNLLAWLVGGLLLCYAAFYNGYPLIYPDTGTYISSGFTNFVPVDRPISYGLFVRHLSLRTSLWYVVLAQGLILSSVVFFFVRYIWPHRRNNFLFLGLILFLVFFSGVSTRTSQIMPDIFAPVPVLCLTVLLFGKQVPLLVRLYLSGVALLGLITHSSHLVIYAMVLGGLIILLGINWFATRKLPLRLRHLGLSIAIVGSAWLVLPGIHAYYGAGFKATRGSHVFLMGRLHQMGILKHFLDNECGKGDYFLCAYKDSLPFDYIWDRKSPIYLTGGWAKQDPDEYAKLTNELLSRPYYAKLFFQTALFGTFHQFFHFQTGNTPEQRSDSPGYQMIQKYFPYEIYPLVLGRQWISERLTYGALNVRETLVFFLCLLGLAAILFQPDWRKKIPDHLFWALVLILLLLIVNAGICGGLSNGNMRYQNRVVWILPLILSLILFDQWPSIWRRFRSGWLENPSAT